MAAHSPSPFGALLRRYRLSAGWTQQELAERADLSVRGISDLERGINLSPRAVTVHLLSNALQLQAADRVDFVAAARGLSPLRGKTEDAAVRPLFVGRQEETAALDAHLAHGGPPLLVFTGEAGIGKTRLLDVAAQRAAALNWTILRAGCRRKSGQEPYAPLIDALSSFVQEMPRARLRAALDGAEWLARLLPELRLPGRPVEVLPPEQERRLMFASVKRFLYNLAGASGTLLVLDDLQWAGADALDLLDAIVRASEGTSVCLVGAYRDTEVGPSSALSTCLADFAQHALIRRIALGPLTVTEAAALLDGLLYEEAVKERILQRAAGVPFFLVSCAQAAARADDQNLPWDIAQGIRQRVAALPADLQQVLLQIAVAGRELPLSLLFTLMPESAETVLSQLSAACEARLLVSVGEHEFQCAHDVIREVVEADAGAAERALAHRRLAEALERAPEPGGRQAAELAWHFRAAGDAARALPYVLLAGDRAQHIFAHTDAEEHFRTALSLARTLADRGQEGEALEKLAHILRVVGRYDEALTVLQEAVDLYRRLGARESEGRASAQVGRIHASQGATEQGVRHLERALDSLRPSERPSRALCELHAVQAYLLFAAGRYGESLVAAERAAELARDLEDPTLLAEAEMRRGTALYLLGRWEGLAVLERTIPLAESLPDTETLDRVLNNLAAAYSLRGEVEQSRVYAERALEVAERRGDPARIGFVLTNVSEGLLQLGHWAQARGHLERAARLLEAVGAHWYLAYAYLQLGKLSVDEGKWEEATRYLEQCSCLANAGGDVTALATAQNYLAEKEILEERPELARRRLNTFLADHAAEGDTLTWMQPALAWSCLEAGDVEAARQSIRAAIPALIEQDQQSWLVPGFLIAGMVAARQCLWDEAQASFEETRSRARSMRWPYYEARSLSEYGLLLAGRGANAEARRMLSAALAVYRRLGAAAYRQRIELSLSELERG